MYESPLPEMFAVMTLCNKAQMEMNTDIKVRSQSLRVQSEQLLWKPPPFNTPSR
jgi:hypothetical protein